MTQVKLYTVVDFDEITLDGLLAYLNARGWKRIDPLILAGIFYEKEGNTLLVPTSSVDDETPRVREIVGELARIDNLSELDVFNRIRGWTKASKLSEV